MCTVAEPLPYGFSALESECESSKKSEFRHCIHIGPEAAPGYQENPEGDGEEQQDYELSESQAIASKCLEELEESSEAGHAQKLDMLYSCIWQHMQPLVKQKANVMASPIRVRLGRLHGVKCPPEVLIQHLWP